MHLFRLHFLHFSAVSVFDCTDIFFYGSFRWLLCHELVSARTADPQSMQADSQGRILQTSLVGGHPTLLEGVREEEGTKRRRFAFKEE